MIGGETLLSLYPIIVKKTDIEINWQVFSRLLVYSLIPLFFGSVFTSLNNIPIWKWIFAGIVNYLHIYSSYRGFQILSPGLAMTFFYMYPIYNLLLLKAFFDYPLSFINASFFIVPLILVYSIYNDRKDVTSVNYQNNESKIKGVGYVTLAAITESIIYIILRSVQSPTLLNPWNSVFFIYFSSLVISIIFLVFKHGGILKNLNDLKSLFVENEYFDNQQKNNENEDLNKYKLDFIKLTIINALIGLIGYVLRFYAIPRLSPVIFSILSFTGIITSHFFGYIFFNEVISVKTSIKLFLLILSLIFIKIKQG
jgi:drug/metabolite transporter (DMT)-like permease